MLPDPEVSLRVELTDEYGGTDDLGEAKMTDECLLLDGYTFASVGIPWSELYRIVNHPFVQQKFDDVWSEDPN